MADNSNTRQQAEAFINALHALEEDGGDGEAALDQITDLYADDATLTNSALKLVGEDRQGKEAVHAFWKEYKKTFGKAYSDFHHIAAGDDSAGLFWVTKGTAPGGEEGGVAYDGSTLLVFNSEGKISHFQGYYDTQQLSRAMGVEKA